MIWLFITLMIVMKDELDYLAFGIIATRTK